MHQVQRTYSYVFEECRGTNWTAVSKNPRSCRQCERCRSWSTKCALSPVAPAVRVSILSQYFVPNGNSWSVIVTCQIVGAMFNWKAQYYFHIWCCGWLKSFEIFFLCTLVQPKKLRNKVGACISVPVQAWKYKVDGADVFGWSCFLYQLIAS